MSYEHNQEVEICKKEEDFLGSYYRATILFVMPTTVALDATEPTKYMVRYETRKNQENTRFLTEVVNEMDIRPIPPQNQYTDYKVNDKVDVFIDGGWWVGSVRRRRYQDFDITLDYSGKEVYCRLNSVRSHLDWNDNEWVDYNASRGQADNNSDLEDDMDTVDDDIDGNYFESNQEDEEAEAKTLKISSKVNEKKTTNFRGVRQTLSGKWEARKKHKGVLKSLGKYDTPEEAARAFDKAAIKFQKNEAKTNFPISDYEQIQNEETEEHKVDEQVQGIERVNQKSKVSRAQVETVSRDQADINIRGNVSNFQIKLKDSQKVSNWNWGSSRSTDNENSRRKGQQNEREEEGN